MSAASTRVRCSRAVKPTATAGCRSVDEATDDLAAQIPPMADRAVPRPAASQPMLTFEVSIFGAAPTRSEELDHARGNRRRPGRVLPATRGRRHPRADARQARRLDRLTSSSAVASRKCANWGLTPRGHFLDAGMYCSATGSVQVDNVRGCSLRCGRRRFRSSLMSSRAVPSQSSVDADARRVGCDVQATEDSGGHRGIDHAGL